MGDYTARLRAALGVPSGVLSRRVVRRWDARLFRRLLVRAPTAGIVHIQYQAAAFDLLGDICLAPLLLRAARPRVRLVTTFHDVREPFLFRGARLLRRPAVQLLARTSHGLIAADAGDLRVLGGPSRTRVLVPIGSNMSCAPPEGYERGAFRRSLGIGDDELVVAYFGLLNASKGLDVLLETVALLPRARVLLVGGTVGASDPTDRQTAVDVRARLADLGPRALLTGFLPPPEVSAHLLAADVALLPYVDGASARRGSLLACAEHGLPTVSTAPASAAVTEAVLAVAPEPRALAAAVERVASDRDEAARLRAGAARLAAQVAWPRIAAAHRALYETVLAR